MYIKILKSILGAILVLAGIIGFFVPIVPGIVLVAVGLFVLGIQKEQIKEWLKKIKF